MTLLQKARIIREHDIANGDDKICPGGHSHPTDYEYAVLDAADAVMGSVFIGDQRHAVMASIVLDGYPARMPLNKFVPDLKRIDATPGGEGGTYTGLVSE